jgi:hypothetical protein
MAADSLAGLGALIRNLAARAWWLAGLAMRRAPRHRPGLKPVDYAATAASKVA